MNNINQKGPASMFVSPRLDSARLEPNEQGGQALVFFLFFMVIAVSITSAAVIVILSNSVGTTRYQEGNNAYYIAQAGIENAILRLVRDPNYTGETFPVDDGTATITVTGSNPKTITSEGKTGNFSRTIEAQVSYTNYTVTKLSWKEIP